MSQGGALAGIRVLDFGHFVAGPLTALLLAEQGADVIHVDPPGGPRWPDPADALFNRSKQRVELDLKRRSDLATALELVAQADVIVENFRPGVMARLGLGAAELTARDPRLIYCSLPGFATDDPRAAQPGWEGLIAAATGIYEPRVPPNPPLSDGPRPLFTDLRIASHFGAYVAAVAITMALIARHRAGFGQWIEAPLFDAVFETIGVHGIELPADQHANLLSAPDAWGGGNYRCGDGRFVTWYTGTPRFLTWFADAAGVGDAWRAEGLLDLDRLRADPVLERALRARLTELFATRDATAWEQVALAANLPFSVARTRAEWVRHPHARETGMLVRLDDPELGPTWMPGLPVELSATPGAVQHARVAHPTDARDLLRRLREQPRAPLQHAREPELRQPLAGVHAVDLCQVLAGPNMGRIIGEFGADVIKINTPYRDRIASHGFVNRGKRTLLLDIQSPAGKEVFWDIVDHVDVVLENFPPGTLARYGLGDAQLWARKPDLILASASAYGDTGSWGTGRGIENTARALTGMGLARSDGPPVPPPYFVNDFGTGLLGAFGLGLALYHRFRFPGSPGQHVQVSLARAATYHQAEHLLDYAGRQWVQPTVADLGESFLQRLYRAADGWLFLAATDADLPALAAVAGVPGASVLTAEDLVDRFAQAPVASWVDRLQARGIGAHAVRTVPDVMHDPWVRARGLSVIQDLEAVGPTLMPGLSVRMSRTPPRLGDPVRHHGRDAALVLAAVGSRHSVTELEQLGVLRVTGVPAPSW